MKIEKIEKFAKRLEAMRQAECYFALTRRQYDENIRDGFESEVNVKSLSTCIKTIASKNGHDEYHYCQHFDVALEAVLRENFEELAEKALNHMRGQLADISDEAQRETVKILSEMSKCSKTGE